MTRLCPNGHPRTPENTINRQRRRCRTCLIEAQKRGYARLARARRAAHAGHRIRAHGNAWRCLTCPVADVDQVAVDRACMGDRTVRLTRAETTTAVMRLTDRGRSARQIAQLLGIAPRTVERHRGYAAADAQEKKLEKQAA